MEAAGIEAYASPTTSLENPHICKAGGTESGIGYSDLTFLVKSWARLNADCRKSVLAVVHAQLTSTLGIPRSADDASSTGDVPTADAAALDPHGDGAALPQSRYAATESRAFSAACGERKRERDDATVAAGESAKRTKRSAAVRVSLSEPELRRRYPAEDSSPGSKPWTRG